MINKILAPALGCALLLNLSGCGGGSGGGDNNTASPPASSLVVQSSTVQSSAAQLSSAASLAVSSVITSSALSSMSSKMSASAQDSSAHHSSSSASDDGFSLVFRDDFDHFDPERWQLMTHSWPGNVALFSSQTVSVADGKLHLKLLPAPAGTVEGGETKPYLGAEVRSVDTIEYGRVSARAKLAKGSAVISALVTIYTPWPADNWNEFDIESLGKDTGKIQFNSMVYTGPTLTPPVTASVTPTQYPTMSDLGFDSAEDFHVYTIEWTPTEARFLIDDVVYHHWVDRMDLIGLPQNILLTIWVSSAPSWAGPITAETGKGEAIYDWVEIWRYTPPVN